MTKNADRRYGTAVWKRLRLEILARDHWSCVECGGTANVADHVTRPEDGGEFWDPANLRALCRACNLRRHHPSKVIAGRPLTERPSFGPPPFAPPPSRYDAPGRHVQYHECQHGPPYLFGYMLPGVGALDHCPPECVAGTRR